MSFKCPRCGSDLFGSSRNPDGTLTRHCHGESLPPCGFTFHQSEDSKYFTQKLGEAGPLAALPEPVPTTAAELQGLAWVYHQSGQHALAGVLRSAADQIEKGQAFKAFVHTTLDAMGAPVDPPGRHRDEGCRVGQRLEWLSDKLAQTEQWNGRRS